VWTYLIRFAGAKQMRRIALNVLLPYFYGLGERVDSSSRLCGHIDGEIAQELGAVKTKYLTEFGSGSVYGTLFWSRVLFKKHISNTNQTRSSQSLVTASIRVAGTNQKPPMSLD